MHADDSDDADALIPDTVTPVPEAAPVPEVAPPAHAPTGPERVVGFRGGRAIHLTVVPVDDALVEVRTAVRFRLMRDAAARDGVTLLVRSGYRSRAEQRWLYQAWRAGLWNRAARPGFSKHQSGRALDLDTRAPAVYPWLAEHAGSFGFRRTVASEPWHWERSPPRHALRVRRHPRRKG